jgi:hypothetical protein
MDLPITIQIPLLWGNQTFKKDQWGFLNFLVGPNATGKTLFAEELKTQCQRHGFKPRYLNAERLSGFEKERYDYFGYSQLEKGLDIGLFGKYRSQGSRYGLAADAFVTLKQKLDVRIRIEANLSQLFGRRIRLAEEGGFLSPKIQKIRQGEEYGLKENECHGLKELIALLTFVYDDEFNCLIIDEPELHLHPQFQTYFLQEVRRLAGDPRVNPTKKCFFLITHSPYVVDIRTLDELRNCVVFQPEKLPAYIDALDKDDEWRLSRFLPRLNTHHKQFLFSSRPIFVEGYRDQQIFTLIQEKRGVLLGASGTCVIDVGGKDELDLFFRLCNHLNIDAQFIADLDAMLEGKLRQPVSRDERSRTYLQTEGLGMDLMTTIGEVSQALDDCLKAFESARVDTLSENHSLKVLHEALSAMTKEDSDTQKQTKRRYVFVLGMTLNQRDVDKLIPSKSEKMSFVKGKLAKAFEAFKSCGVHVLPRGELENYLPLYKGSPYRISDNAKAEVFITERDFILTNDLDEGQFHSRYKELITILDEASGSITVNTDLFLNRLVGDWIHTVQSVYILGEFVDRPSLERNARLDWQSHSRVFELVEFSSNTDGFTCSIKLKPLVDPTERVVEFDNSTNAASFKLPPVKNN